jgi:hypothetical protein
MLVARSRFSNAITQYPATTRGRRVQTFLKQTGQSIPAIPSDCVPIRPPTEDRRQWTTLPDAGSNCIPAPPPPPLPHTFVDYVSRLDPALQTLVSDVEILVPINELVALLARTTTLTLVGDGGAKTCRGSFGAVAALDSIRIIRVKGPVTGPDPRSYRAESHAMAAIILCVVLLHRVVPVLSDELRHV